MNPLTIITFLLIIFCAVLSADSSWNKVQLKQLNRFKKLPKITAISMDKPITTLCNTLSDEMVRTGLNERVLICQQKSGTDPINLYECLLDECSFYYLPIDSDDILSTLPHVKEACKDNEEALLFVKRILYFIYFQKNLNFFRSCFIPGDEEQANTKDIRQPMNVADGSIKHFGTTNDDISDDEDDKYYSTSASDDMIFSDAHEELPPSMPELKEPTPKSFLYFNIYNSLSSEFNLEPLKFDNVPSSVNQFDPISVETLFFVYWNPTDAANKFVFWVNNLENSSFRRSLKYSIYHYLYGPSHATKIFPPILDLNREQNPDANLRDDEKVSSTFEEVNVDKSSNNEKEISLGEVLFIFSKLNLVEEEPTSFLSSLKEAIFSVRTASKSVKEKFKPVIIDTIKDNVAAPTKLAIQTATDAAILTITKATAEMADIFSEKTISTISLATNCIKARLFTPLQDLFVLFNKGFFRIIRTAKIILILIIISFFTTMSIFFPFFSKTLLLFTVLSLGYYFVISRHLHLFKSLNLPTLSSSLLGI